MLVTKVEKSEIDVFLVCTLSSLPIWSHSFASPILQSRHSEAANLAATACKQLSNSPRALTLFASVLAKDHKSLQRWAERGLNAILSDALTYPMYCTISSGPRACWRRRSLSTLVTCQLSTSWRTFCSGRRLRRRTRPGSCWRGSWPGSRRAGVYGRDRVLLLQLLKLLLLLLFVVIANEFYIIPTVR